MSKELVERLRDKERHSAEAFGVEEYLPMRAFWGEYEALSAEAADEIERLNGIVECLTVLVEKNFMGQYWRSMSHYDCEEVRLALSKAHKVKE